MPRSSGTAEIKVFQSPSGRMTGCNLPGLLPAQPTGRVSIPIRSYDRMQLVSGRAWDGPTACFNPHPVV